MNYENVLTKYEKERIAAIRKTLNRFAKRRDVSTWESTFFLGVIDKFNKVAGLKTEKENKRNESKQANRERRSNQTAAPMQSLSKGVYPPRPVKAKKRPLLFRAV